MTKELPQYQCTRIVGALKITAITHIRLQGICRVSHYEIEGEGALNQLMVSCDYVAKYRPEVGGYYLKNSDGHELYLTAEVFEKEYRPIQYPAKRSFIERPEHIRAMDITVNGKHYVL